MGRLGRLAESPLVDRAPRPCYAHGVLSTRMTKGGALMRIVSISRACRVTAEQGAPTGLETLIF